MHSIGAFDEEEKNYIPDRYYKKVVWEGRIWLLVFCFIIGLCLYYKSILPILYVIGPTFYGFPFVFLIVITQHVGLNDDVLDYRLNTRTFYTNYFIRFHNVNVFEIPNGTCFPIDNVKNLIYANKNLNLKN